MNKKTWNTVAQISLVILTTLSYALTSFKFPQYGLIIALFAQIFWIYSSYKAWKEANQIGIFINTILITLTIIFGVINYWIF